MNSINDFRTGQRVQAHPGTDTWMRGDRYGTIERIGHLWIYVRMDRSGKLIAFKADNLMDAS